MENGNIKVVVRIKPLAESQADRSIIDRVLDETIYLREQTNQSHINTKFTFDKILRNSTQKEVFECVGNELVQTVFEGIHGTALMYGQTASGKTYTCMGPSLKDNDKKGLIPRIVERIFEQIEECAQNIEFRLKISLVEIYMEKIKDLLDVNKDNLKVRESTARGVYIENATQVYVGSKEEVYHFIQFANNNRSLAHTNMNQASSRSHLVFVMTVYQNNLEDMSAKSAKLTLVDLAGSEKVGKTGAEGKVLDEARQINKSLLALGNVINALTEDKLKHIPYRDSKLTRILQESLGGNAKTNLIINISSHEYNEAQTQSTLRFALRAKRIKNKPTVNREYTVAELILLLEKAENKIKEQERYIKELKKNPNTSERYSLMSVISNISELEKVDSRMEEIPDVPLVIDRDWVQEIQVLNDQIDAFKDENISLQSLVNVLKKQNLSLTEQNKELEKEIQVLQEGNERDSNLSGRRVNQSFRTEGNQLRRATKKKSLFASPLLGLKVKENILMDMNSLDKIDPGASENKELSEIRLNISEIKDTSNIGDEDERIDELEQLLAEQKDKNTHLNQLMVLNPNSQQKLILELQSYIDDLLQKYYTAKKNESNLKTNLKIVETKLAKRQERIGNLQTAVMVNKQSIQLFKKKHSELETELKSKKNSFFTPNTIKRPFTSLRSSSRDSKIVKVLLPTHFKIPDIQEDIEEESDESEQSIEA